MGRQVYISDEHHKKLKIASTQREKDMGEIVEEHIEDIDVPGWEQMQEKEVA